MFPFDELAELPREPFRQATSRIDAFLAKRYGVAVDQLRPWHYQDPFFQEAPDVASVRFDTVFAQADIIAVCRKFYAGIGLPIDDVLQRSDLDAVTGSWDKHPSGNGEGPGPPVGLVILMEGAEGVRSPAELEEWWAGGVRLIGPAWAANRFCGGTNEPGRPDAGGL